MKKLLVLGIFPILFLMGLPVGGASPEYAAEVEIPRLPLTILGTEYEVNKKIYITSRVTNTGTVTFGTDVGHAVYVFPNPTEAGPWVAWSWGLYGLEPTKYIDLKGPKDGLPLNIPGKYTVISTVMVDFDGDGVWEYPYENIAVDTDTFTVTPPVPYEAKVEILSIQAAMIGAFGALIGLLVGTRIWL